MEPIEIGELYWKRVRKHAEKKSVNLTDLSVHSTDSSVEFAKNPTEKSVHITKKNLLSLFQQMTSVDSTYFFSAWRIDIDKLK